MNQTYYDRKNQRLVFVRENATAQYWEKRWQATNLKQQIESDSQNLFYRDVTQKFLSPLATVKILEGGCGQGAVVLSLQKAGYRAVGIDYAEATIHQVKALYPELDVRVGDVTQLNFSDQSFDGYWSLGVIEHDYQGFTAISQEIYRVLKPSGYLFITFPYLNPLRRVKASFGLYPAWPASPSAELLEHFYQFALNTPHTIKQLTQLGLTLKYQQPLDGFKGLKDELYSSWLQRLYSTKQPPLTYLRNGLGALVTPLAGHIWLGVFQKNE